MPSPTRGLIFAPSETDRCDSYRLGGAVVDHDALNGLWRMWYYCRDADFAGPPTLGTGRIALALSRNGIDWERFDGPCAKGSVFEPSSDPAAFDCNHVGLTDVRRGPGYWIMHYFGGDNSARETRSTALGQAVVGLSMRPGIAISRDGISWERVPGDGPGGALLDHAPGELYAGWPNAFWNGREHVMQFTAPSPDLGAFHTRVAVSKDGRSWSRIGDLAWADGTRPFDEGGIVTRQVMSNPMPGGRRFLMIYTATDCSHKRAIAAATSDDGMAWHHLYDEPIFTVGKPGAWDSLGVAANRLVVEGDRLHFYYYGFQSLGADDAMRGIGLAMCGFDDLRNLERWER